MLGGESKITEAIEDAMLYLGQKHKVKPVILKRQYACETFFHQ